MKTRQGFVSNSSSSSFIIVGVCVGDEDHYETLNIEYIEKKNFSVYVGYEDGVEGTVIGNTIANFDECEEDCSVGIGKIVTIAADIKEFLKDELANVRLFYGMNIY